MRKDQEERCTPNILTEEERGRGIGLDIYQKIGDKMLERESLR